MRATSFQDRASILTLANAGHTYQEIAQQIGVSVATVGKWLRRGRRYGRQGLTSHVGRPATGAMSTFLPALNKMLHAWREAHPGWGPQTLLTEMKRDNHFSKQAIPSVPTIARWLNENGLTRHYERHRELPQSLPSSVNAPHQEWEMDARGYELVPEVGVISLIDLSDRFSKVKLISYPCWLGERRATRHPTAEDYQLVLRIAFSEWGLPDRLFVDRDSVFHDNTSKSPFPTQLHLWLLALGIALNFGYPGHPTERGMIERSHQIWDRQVLEGPTFASWEILWQALRERRNFLNEQLPNASLGNTPPLVAHPEARKPRRLYRPEWETVSLDLSRVYTYLSQGKWFRKASNIGAVSLGRERYTLGLDWARHEVEITFDHASRHFVFWPEGDISTTHLAAKGISIPELMGELGPLAHLDGFQLALPFSWDEYRMLQLCETLQ